MGKKIRTKTIHYGVEPENHFGSISDPLYRNSTLIFQNYKSFLNAKKYKFNVPYYGRISTYTTRRFEKLSSKLYEARNAILTSSGLSAITITFLALLKKNDEILIYENCYEPVYNFATNELRKFGIKSHFYSNNIKEIAKSINSKTKVLYIESPGSLNYEVLEIKEIVKICKKKGIITIMDNTWSTFLGCNPLEIGVNIVIESLTKYFSGHSDNFLGLVALNSPQLAKTIKTTSVRLGDYVSSESCFQASKGLKTLKLRLEKHGENAEKVFEYLKSKKIVKKILYLPDPKNKFHSLWKKYHKLNNGLITFSIQKKKNISLFIDKLALFRLGFSWGGFESLIIPINNLQPTKKMSKKNEYWFRIHVGLEAYSDLVNDLEKAFKSYEN
jgi:cystathionine beta-lyase